MLAASHGFHQLTDITVASHDLSHVTWTGVGVVGAPSQLFYLTRGSFCEG